VTARRTIVVYQARGGEGAAGVGRRGRRHVGSTAPVCRPRLGTVTTSASSQPCPTLVMPVNRPGCGADDRGGHESYVVTVKGACVVIFIGGQQPSPGYPGTSIRGQLRNPGSPRLYTPAEDMLLLSSARQFVYRLLRREALRCKYGGSGS
jgi:hypothetical protein